MGLLRGVIPHLQEIETVSYLALYARKLEEISLRWNAAMKVRCRVNLAAVHSSSWNVADGLQEYGIALQI